MYLLIKLFAVVLIIGLFLYSKLLPHKAKLNNKYLSTFNFFQSIFNPILNVLKPIFKPLQVGTGLAVDSTQMVLFIVLLLIITLM